jgi:hypothetical protein
MRLPNKDRLHVSKDCFLHFSKEDDDYFAFTKKDGIPKTFLQHLSSSLTEQGSQFYYPTNSTEKILYRRCCPNLLNN